MGKHPCIPFLTVKAQSWKLSPRESGEGATCIVAFNQVSFHIHTFLCIRAVTFSNINAYYLPTFNHLPILIPPKNLSFLSRWGKEESLLLRLMIKPFIKVLSTLFYFYIFSVVERVWVRCAANNKRSWITAYDALSYDFRILVIFFFSTSF